MPSAPRHTVARRPCGCTAPGQTEPAGRPHRCDGWLASNRAKRKQEVGQSREARDERSERPGPTAAHGTPRFDVVALPLVLVAPDRNLRCVESAWSNRVRQRPIGACCTVNAHRGDASRTGRIERAPGIDAGRASPARGARRDALRASVWRYRGHDPARQRVGPGIASPRRATRRSACERLAMSESRPHALARRAVHRQPRSARRGVLQVSVWQCRVTTRPASASSSPHSRAPARSGSPALRLSGSPALRLSGFQPTFTASSLAE